MHIEQAISELRCQIANSVFEKYQSDVYGLFACPIDYDEDEILEKQLLLSLLENCEGGNCQYCDINYIKSLI